MNLFKRKTSEVDKLILEFLKGGGMKKFIEDQAKANQEQHFIQLEIERNKMRKERYDYLTHLMDNDVQLNEKQSEEYSFLRFKLLNKL